MSGSGGPQRSTHKRRYRPTFFGSASYLEPSRFGVRVRFHFRARFNDTRLPYGSVLIQLSIDPEGPALQEGPFAR